MSIIDSSLSSSSVAATTPDVPVNWMPASSLTASRPQLAEIEAAEGAAVELIELDEYASVFGDLAPPREGLAACLAAAAEASQERRRAEAWLAYLRDQETRSWAETGPMLRNLRRLWTAASSLDARLPVRAPRLAHLLETRVRVAMKAVRARKRNKAVPPQETQPSNGSTNQGH